MTLERWRAIARLYEAALEQAETEREAFLAAACVNDPLLRLEIDSLLAQDRETGPLDNPVWVPDNLFVPAPSLITGAVVGPYVVEGVLGAGGMGEVYRARDTRLGRGVALKVLPTAFINDPERRARFQREAQLLAALNHPHIAAIHGFEDSGSVHALVLELVEGPTLADRLRDGPIPLQETVTIAAQMIDALAAAHDQGIVHRDLKPANVKLRDDGTVKVLDFGLARLVQTDGGAPADPNVSPTITSPAMVTGAGVILGTAAYMSPEQARGRPADARSDIWAFGCVLYEMLSGTRPFVGEDVADTLAAILRAEPDWQALPATTPPPLRRLVQRCLQKDRRRRLAAIADARIELEDTTAANDRPTSSSSRLAWILAGAALFLSLIGAGFAVRGSRDALPAASVRFTIGAPETASFGGRFGGGTGSSAQFAISSDGQHLVFVAGGNGQYQLWLRSLDSLIATPLSGTEGAAFPFWSPDGRSVGFFTPGKLKKIQISGGPPVNLSDVALGGGGAWNRDDVIVFSSGTSTSGLQRVSSSGGDVLDVTTVDRTRGETAHRWPYFLPDGRHFLYTALSGACCPAPEPSTIRLASLDSDDPAVTLVEAESSAMYASGHLLFARNATLLAQAFDPDSHVLSGETIAIAKDVSWEGSRYVSAAVSDNGTLVYGQGGVPTTLQMTWFDRAGTILGRVGNPIAYEALSLSPDGRQIAVALSGGRPANLDLWLFDVASGNRSRLTTDPGPDSGPIWAPDNQHIAFEATRAGRSSLRQISPDGTADEALLDGADSGNPTSWSMDGRYLAFTRKGPSGSSDIWALPMFGDRKPLPVVNSAFTETSGAFSPDGKWIAYTTDETGQLSVFVQPFPGAGNRHQITREGGSHPQWRADGKELFYIAVNGARDGTLMAVPVNAGPRFETGEPQPLFGAGPPRGYTGQIYAVTKDGQKFLVNERPQQRPVVTPLTVVVNWLAALKH